MPSPSKISTPAVRRTQTPPDLKWLLNERAAVAGELQDLEQLKAALSSKLTAWQSAYQRVQRQVLAVENRLALGETTLEAMDRSIGLLHSDIDPQVAGVVRAWAGKSTANEVP